MLVETCEVDQLSLKSNTIQQDDFTFIYFA